MPILAEIWGLSLNQTVLLLAVILILVDFFVPTDISTNVAYVMLAVLVALNINAHPLYKVLAGLLAWFAILTFHYLFWRAFVQRIINNVIAPDKFRAGADGLIDETGEMLEIDSRKLVKVRGDLWPCSGPSELAAGDKVKVTSVTDGILSVMLVERSS